MSGDEQPLPSGWSTSQVVIGAIVGLVVLVIVNKLYRWTHPKPALVLRGAGAQQAAAKKHEATASSSSSASTTTTTPSSSSNSSTPSSSSSSSPSSSSSASPSVFLNQQRQSVVLSRREALSHDTLRLTFDLPSPDAVLGLPVGKHFKLYGPNALQPAVPGEWNGQPDKEAAKREIVRAYTPVTSDRDRGFFQLVVKTYRPQGEGQRFCDGGKMSRYLETLREGDSLALSGPFGRIEYAGRGLFRVDRRAQPQRRRIGMIAGGTGITPMLQIVAAVLADEGDESEMWLVFANQTEGDILVRDYLEAHRAAHPGRLHLWYTLDRPPEGWQYSAGFISEEMLRAHLPPPAEDSVVLMCGPPPMIQYACQPNLDKIGFSKEAQIIF